jgi:hypothetical protein
MATSPLFNWPPVDPPRRSASRFWLLSAEAPAIAAPAARVPLRKERRFLLFGIAFSFFIISRKSVRDFVVAFRIGGGTREVVPAR